MFPSLASRYLDVPSKRQQLPARRRCERVSGSATVGERVLHGCDSFFLDARRSDPLALVSRSSR